MNDVASPAATLPEVDAAGLAAALSDHALPLLVEYMADHCVWCQRLEPVLAAAQPKFDGRLRMLKVNVERHPEVKPTDHPRAVPTIALYRQGRMIMTKSGMIQRQQLDVFLNHWLDPANDGLA
ncbi:thioredoxin family protein [Nevskia sp.]|uniref:thioredoxin family protein n=1 Tax=Nevskia sp. TaxID=1929292 RepID=UPI0025D103BF|nr:thioredoxin family protein [Nevskia sp.]HET7796411.1 thioredoxin family protein [Nevskia sp.]